MLSQKSIQKVTDFCVKVARSSLIEDDPSHNDPEAVSRLAVFWMRYITQSNAADLGDFVKGLPDSNS